LLWKGPRESGQWSVGYLKRSARHSDSAAGVEFQLTNRALRFERKAAFAALERLAMMRTKWMRLGVRDPADILRWAGAQSTRQLDDFRYRIIHGREFVSFRMVPRYRVEIGTSDIIIVAHVMPNARQRVAAAVFGMVRSAARRASAAAASLRSRRIVPAPAHSAELYDFAPARLGSSARRQKRR
jgi:hypothetical protein